MLPSLYLIEIMLPLNPVEFSSVCEATMINIYGNATMFRESSVVSQILNESDVSFQKRKMYFISFLFHQVFMLFHCVL